MSKLQTTFVFLLNLAMHVSDGTLFLYLHSQSSPSDDECEGNLVCMQRSGDEPIPGCGGSPREAADYCILPAGRSSVVAAAQEAPSSGAVAVGTRRLATIASCVAIAGAAVFAML